VHEKRVAKAKISAKLKKEKQETDFYEMRKQLRA